MRRNTLERNMIHYVRMPTLCIGLQHRTHQNKMLLVKEEIDV